MKLWEVSLGLAGMIAALVAANDASAQTREPIVKARIEISLTDPDTNNVWYAYRLSQLSWADAKECERRKGKTGKYNIAAVERYGLVNANGKPPTLKVESIECVNIRE